MHVLTCIHYRLHRFGGVWPITVTEDPIEKVTIAGRDWDLYFGYNGEMKVYSFLPPDDNPISDFSGDVKEFFDHLTSSQSFPESTQYMLSEPNRRACSLCGTLTSWDSLSVRHGGVYWWTGEIHGFGVLGGGKLGREKAKFEIPWYESV